MPRIILHIGDRVTHNTYGEGVVTIVDEEFCTIKFGEEELTFRLPDAFEDGFLRSDDAVYAPDEEADEEDWNEEVEDDDEDLGHVVPTPSARYAAAGTPRNRKLGLVDWLVVIALPASYTLPFAVLFLIIYLGTESTLFLILTNLFFLLYLVLVIYGVYKLKQPEDPSKRYAASSGDDDTDSAAQTAGLIFGTALLGHFIGKHHRSGSRDTGHDWLWQEKYRSHDDYDEDNW